MRFTEKFGLNLPEVTDPVSIAHINDNTEMIAALLGKNIRMACGTYLGDDGATNRIDTPGMKPVAVLMNSAKTVGSMQLGVGENIHSVPSDISVPSGWLLWVGSDLPAKYYKKQTDYDPGTGLPTGGYYYKEYNTMLNFTPGSGYLEWSLETLGDKDAYAANNASGVTYQWIAFGEAE